MKGVISLAMRSFHYNGQHLGKREREDDGGWLEKGGNSNGNLLQGKKRGSICLCVVQVQVRTRRK